jgi:hypothetical protein
MSKVCESVVFVTLLKVVLEVLLHSIYEDFHRMVSFTALVKTYS